MWLLPVAGRTCISGSAGYNCWQLWWWVVLCYCLICFNVTCSNLIMTQLLNKPTLAVGLCRLLVHLIFKWATHQLGEELPAIIVRGTREYSSIRDYEHRVECNRIRWNRRHQDYFGIPGTPPRRAALCRGYQIRSSLSSYRLMILTRFCRNPSRSSSRSSTKY